jgi:type II secretory pathway pseudopilin PulG
MRQQDFQSNSILSKGCGCLSLSLFSLIFFGIILEIVLPSFFVMAKNAKQSEAKQYVSAMNKGQQAYYAVTSAFSNYIPDLGLGIKTETTNYKYSTRVTKKAAFNYALAKDKNLNNYFGGVFLVHAKELDPNADRDEMTTATILCETEKRPLFRFKPADEPAEPIYQNGEVICGKGTTAVTK